MTSSEALQEAIKLCGGEAELARYIGITVQAVGQWKVAPAARVLQIEAVTDGKVTRHQLRPDVFGEQEAAA